MGSQTTTIGVKRRNGFTIIEDRAILDERLGKETLLVYIALCMHSNKAQVCWPSLSTIAKEARCARSTVQRCLKELVDLGYIEKETRKKKGDKEHDSSLYTVLGPSEEEKPDKEGKEGGGIPSHGTPYTAPRYRGVPPSGKELYPVELDSLNQKEGAADAARTEEPVTPVSEKPSPPAMPPAAADDKALYAFVKASFEWKYGDFESYPREGKAIKQIIAQAKKDCPENPAEWLGRLIKAFWELTETGKAYWKEKAFLPHKLLGSYVDVKKRLRESQLDPEATRIFAEMAS